MTIKQQLIDVLEGIDIPHLERQLTNEEAGASVRVISEIDGLTTVSPPDQEARWTEIRTDWPTYADRILQGLLAAGLEIRRIVVR